ncbi:hypothetical protein B7P43_G08234 [Cryptotermes secundus]|uniref:Reverse transcriptase domain-containing protein n=1 Tax=Cryptotermes secundus TaxID=105785 RepID=A0A2J7QJB5_9NEOP|nr:hypothetical protein B7P43_G08234 [Cryptotermes secundus]
MSQYYQNVRGLRTKYVEFYDNVCSTDFDIIFLTETWLKDSCCDCNIFPSKYTVYRSDRVSSSKARGGGVLTAILSSWSYSDLVKPDPYHSPLIIDVHLPHTTYNPDYKFSHQKFATGNYTLLYNTLSACDWSGVYGATSADDAVASLNASVQAAMEDAIPRCPTRKSKFPFWYSSSLRYYIGKKNYFHCCFKKKQTDYYYDKFISYRKLVKRTIKTDRLQWLKSIDNDLKSQPHHLWKYVSSFRKHTLGYIQLQVYGLHLDEPTVVAYTFEKHFQSLYDTHCPIDLPPLSQPTEFLTLASISDADVNKAIKRLKPSKSVGPGDIPGFVIKGCSAIFIPVLRHIFNLSLPQQQFPTSWKEATIVPVFKRGNPACVSNYRPSTLLNNISKLLEFIIHHHISHYIKLHPNQHGFTKSKSTAINLVSFLDIMTPVVCSQCQADAVYFDFSSAFDLVPHTLLLHKLSSLEFSDGYLNWLDSYLANRRSRVRVSDALSRPLRITFGVPQGSVLGPLLFNVFINDLCNSIRHSHFLFFADDLKIFHIIDTSQDCLLLQNDIHHVSDWCSANSMSININLCHTQGRLMSCSMGISFVVLLLQAPVTLRT